ncbi:hypothetical protein A3H16_03650 [Candidatus Kaiserbacteria bacterium RIFCSPLOWO2_12_FULL_53_8]|uniref:Uncharacterized protein n=1 Tax=Candidatus Kaiserbacteria bacterium RIFCSPLOWO2_12_FULL_53_8 TaxID=1798529 RepID=A0A1F6G1Z1_9BACT|nr:MAG: hypothetical protein A3H16_03650 [Candidatus Kaiserbacteria bacterium RIFCSPLOWO2_12_FULL_53_8]
MSGLYTTRVVPKLDLDKNYQGIQSTTEVAVIFSSYGILYTSQMGFRTTLSQRAAIDKNTPVSDTVKDMLLITKGTRMSFKKGLEIKL